MKKLAIVTTHPIQYNAPFFALLAKSDAVQVKVFYTWEQSKEGALFDPNFKQTITWDIPLLEGYDYHFTKNTSKKPGSSHFTGIDNPNLLQEISEYNPNGILLFGWSFKSHLKLMRHFHHRIPILFRGDSTLLDESPDFSVKKLIRRMLLGWVYKHIETALYTGEANKEYFIKHGVSSNKLIRAPHAIDNNRFQYAPDAEEKAAAWRAELGISTDARVALFSGKLEPKKNPIGLLKAFLEADVPNTHLIIAGSGVLESKLKEMAAGQKTVHFIGFQNQQQMPIVYRLSEVYVLPSVGPGETWGLALNEAMACGRKVIASSVCGGAKDLIQSEEIGTIVSKANQVELLEALKKNIIKPRVELLNDGKKAQTYISSFSFHEIATAVESWINNIK